MDLGVVFERVPLILSIVGRNLDPLLCQVFHVVNITGTKVVFVQVLERQTPILGALIRLNIGPTLQAACNLRDQLQHLQAIHRVRRQNHAWRYFMRGTRNHFILHISVSPRRVHSRY